LADRGRHSPETCLLSCAAEGGSSGILCSCAGMIAGAFYGSPAAAPLFGAMINHKQISALISRAAAGSGSRRDAAAFINAEISLTAKETDEREARLKHCKTKTPARKKERRDETQAMTRHVVESWTKIDKARWKKELQHNREDEET
ncbi:MAG: hypothetical protein ACRCUT_09730, partial [Spirochaetota bacterium]